MLRIHRFIRAFVATHPLYYSSFIRASWQHIRCIILLSFVHHGNISAVLFFFHSCIRGNSSAVLFFFHSCIRGNISAVLFFFHSCIRGNISAVLFFFHSCIRGNISVLLFYFIHAFVAKYFIRLRFCILSRRIVIQNP